MSRGPFQPKLSCDATKGGTLKLSFTPSYRQTVGARHVPTTPGREGDWGDPVSALYGEAAKPAEALIAAAGYRKGMR